MAYRYPTPRPWLAELRNAAGLTQDELAEKCDVTPQAISYYETGKRTPRPVIAQRMADILGFDARRFNEEKAAG